MSLAILIASPEGLVLAADSRVTLGGTTAQVSFDSSHKVLSFKAPHSWVGAVTVGAAAINLRPLHTYVSEFEQALPPDRVSVEEFANHFHQFLLQKWMDWMSGQAASGQTPQFAGASVFVVAGFNVGSVYGEAWKFEVPGAAPASELTAGRFAVHWYGNGWMVTRLLHGYDQTLEAGVTSALGLDTAQQASLRTALEGFAMPPPVAAMGLQDCIDAALFFIEMTMEGQRLLAVPRTVGGPIDVAVLTSDRPLAFVRRKRIIATQRRSQRRE